MSEKSLNPAAWKSVYKMGGVAALTAVILFRRNFSAELMISNGFGLFDVPAEAPVTAVGWFDLFQNDWFVGLMLFNLIDMINYLLVGLIFLALYGVLKQTNQSVMVLSLALTLISIILFLTTNQAFSMLSLSRQYAMATAAQQERLLAAGEALLAIDNPGLFYEGFGYLLTLFFILLAGLLISIVMLKSPVFHKAAATIGILANLLALGYFIALPFGTAVVWLPPTLSAPLRLIWYILIAAKLLQLGRRSASTGNNK